MTGNLFKDLMEVYRVWLMVFVSVLVNILAWVAVGYAFGSYFARHARCGTLCAVSASVLGSLLGGFLAFIAYGLPETFLWANNILFAFVGSLGFLYIALPEKERSLKVEKIVKSFKKFDEWRIDLAGLKR